MDMTESEATVVKQDTGDTSLPAVTASLEMLTVNTLASPENRRILRKRSPRVVTNENLNRRCSLRPKKRTVETNDKTEGAEGANEEANAVRGYYLNKSLKRKLHNLETIFEENDDTSESSTYMSVKRYKRMIQFKEKPTDSKLKKRRAKIKKIFGSKISFKRRCASMQILLDKLNDIRSESPPKIESEVK